MGVVQTTIKNLASAALVNNLLSSGDQVVLWRDSVTGFLWIRLDTGVDVPIAMSGGTSLVGGFDPSLGSVAYPAAVKGQWWFFTADGSMGVPPVDVQEGDTMTCITDTAGGVGAVADFVLGEHNILQASETQVGVSRFSTFAELVAGILDNVGVSPKNIIDLLQTTGISSLKTDLLEAATDVAMTIKGFDSAAELAPGNDIVVQGGAATAGTAANDGSESGAATLRALPGGDATGTGNGGDSGIATLQSLKGGDAVDAASTGGDSGAATLNTQQAGNGGALGGNAGIANVQAGEGGNSATGGGTGGNGGEAQLIAGAGGDDSHGGSGAGGPGGNVVIRAGAGGAGFAAGEVGIIDLQSGVKFTRAAAMTADAGKVQAGAAEIVTANNRFTIVAGDGDSAILPKAVAGLEISVVNKSGGGFFMNLFPEVGEFIDGLAVNTATPVADGSFVTMFCYVDGTWDFQ